VLINGGSASASEIVAGACKTISARRSSVRARSVTARCRPSFPRRGQRWAAAHHGALLHAVGPFHSGQGHYADIEVLQEVPEDLKARTDTKGEASLRGHLKAEGNEESGSQSYVPPDEKDDRALKEALALLRGTTTDVSFPPNPKAPVP
jgi:carboxyl-terminal processing protease